MSEITRVGPDECPECLEDHGHTATYSRRSPIITAEVGPKVHDPVPPRPDLYGLVRFTPAHGWVFSYGSPSRGFIEQQLEHHQKSGECCHLVMIPGDGFKPERLVPALPEWHAGHPDDKDIGRMNYDTGVTVGMLRAFYGKGGA